MRTTRVTTSVLLAGGLFLTACGTDTASTTTTTDGLGEDTLGGRPGCRHLAVVADCDQSAGAAAAAAAAKAGKAEAVTTRSAATANGLRHDAHRAGASCCHRACGLLRNGYVGGITGSATGRA